MKRLTTTVFLLVILQSGYAKPQWVKMMDDEQTNYFKAVKKFENYWKHHFKPNEEEEAEHGKAELEQEKDPRRFIVKLFQSKEEAREQSNELAFAYKKFMKWQIEMLPYVKADGSIMSSQERIDAWKQLQNMNAKN